MTQSTYLPTNITGSVKNILATIAQETDSEREEGMCWYYTAHHDACDVADKAKINLWPTCQVLSVISPMRYWETNVKDCALTIDVHALDKGLRFPLLSQGKVSMPAGRKPFVKAWAILDGTTELKEKGAPKTYNFAKTTESPSTWMGVVVDSKAVALWSDDYSAQPKVLGLPTTYQIPLGLYRRCAADYVTAAELMGILPSQAQARAWLVQRRLSNDSGSFTKGK